MKKTYKFALLIFLSGLLFQSCQDNDDVIATTDLDVQDFVWKGMNQYYLWQADVPNLADDRFANQAALDVFLKGYTDPEDLFQALRVDKSIDRFSWIVDDYRDLEGALGGITKNNGLDFQLAYKTQGSDDIYGYVRYVLPNSDAAAKNVTRGTIFYGINGIQLNVSNYSSLLSNDTYTLNLADIKDGVLTPNGKSITLTKSVVAENPIFIKKVLTVGTHKIGYLMYNGFFNEYDLALNDAFGEFKSAQVTDLVLDLRYNGGGSVLTATRLASMIHGQSTGKIFAKQEWNAKVNDYFRSNNPEQLNNNFTDKIDTTPINSLNIKKIYILTTGNTASASELVINGLKPYIEVVQIGGTTVGKNVGSITLYDSPTFGKENINPNHRYAMQPLVLRIVNAAGFGDYTNGLLPDIAINETPLNLGVLGDTEEPFLKTAINKITGSTARFSAPSNQRAAIFFKDTKAMNGQNQMFIEKAPEGLQKAL
ncbi:S41 family peptidase [Flavobacterium frigidarium]|uniref:S41 family peptidase n=1 Tax=Flavobacterium frigidarium TaxID=99286 RepID=A0ABV4KC15_9FLAO